MINKMFEIIKDKEKQYQILMDRYDKVNDKINKQNYEIKLWTIKGLLVELEDELEWEMK
jgi:GTP-binding protein EngB required for normal cell division